MFLSMINSRWCIVKPKGSSFQRHLNCVCSTLKSAPVIILSLVRLFQLWVPTWGMLTNRFNWLQYQSNLHLPALTGFVLGLSTRVDQLLSRQPPSSESTAQWAQVDGGCLGESWTIAQEMTLVLSKWSPTLVPHITLMETFNFVC